MIQGRGGVKVGGRTQVPPQLLLLDIFVTLGKLPNATMMCGASYHACWMCQAQDMSWGAGSWEIAHMPGSSSDQSPP